MSAYESQLHSQDLTSGKRSFVWLIILGTLLALGLLIPTTSQRIFAQVGSYYYTTTPTDDTTTTTAAKQGTLTVTPTSGEIKTQLIMTGKGFQPNEALLIVFKSDPKIVSSMVAGPNGEFLSPVKFKVPKDAEVGSHDITAENVDTRVVRATIKFTVAAEAANLSTAATGVEPNGVLAATGMNVVSFSLMGLLLFGLGLALFKSTRSKPLEGP